MKHHLLLSLVLSALASQPLTAETPKAAAPSSPEAVVSDLYKLDTKGHSPFSQTKDHGVVTRYFSDPLAQLIWKDAVTSKGEVGALDGDPLYNAQDMDIKKFALHPAKAGKDSAVVIASFENIGKKTIITFDLVLTKEGWKVSDIKYADGTHLLGILKGK